MLGAGVVKIKNNSQHKSVLIDEVSSFLSPYNSKGIYIDATVGGGGHAEKILESSCPSGRLIGIDIDPLMLRISAGRLQKFKQRCLLVESNYTELAQILEKHNIGEIDGAVFDLGVSTEHFKQAERGFSLTEDGPLDMRLSPRTKINAFHIVNEWPEKDLANILWKYGEEKQARRIARHIVRKRKETKIMTTGQLRDLIAGKIGGRRGKRVHPATKSFQALRIAVNDELDNIETVLPIVIDRLKPGGRICVISFHSLEDRLVKTCFKSLARGCICPPEVVECRCQNRPKIKLITGKPVRPKEEELAVNPRSRSARLRIAERI